MLIKQIYNIALIVTVVVICGCLYIAQHRDNINTATTYQPNAVVIPDAEATSSEELQASLLADTSSIDIDDTNESWNPFENYGIQGKVLDKSIGMGVQDVNVYVLTWDESFLIPGSMPILDNAKKALTHEDGSFSIPKLKAGSYGILIRHPSYIQDRLAYKHIITQENPDQKVILSLEPGAIIVGSLTWEGKPVSNQPITLHFDNGSDHRLETYSDEGGMYVFDGLDSATIRLTSIHYDKEYNIQALVKRGKATVVDIAFSGEASSIAGSITPFHPERYYAVTAVNSDGIVIAGEVFDDGTFVYEGLKPDVYRVEVKSNQWGRVISKQDILIRTLSDKITPCIFYTCETTNISGQITNLEPDEKVSVFAVKNTMIKGLNNTVYTQLKRSSLAVSADIKEEGKFEFPELESGNYTLVARGMDERMVYLQLTVVNNGTKPNEENPDALSISMVLDDSWTHIVDDTYQ